MRLRWLAVIGLSVCVLAACSQSQPEAVVSDSTRTLIPPTFTPTPAPMNGTPTPTDLPSAALVSAPTPVRTSMLPTAAQAVLERVMADLLAQPGVDPADVRLWGLDEVTWRNESWGCPSRFDEGYTELAFTSGYRMVFGVGSRVFIYHTDRRKTFFICEDRAWLGLESDPIPLDPIEESMVELSTRDAAKHFAVPETDVRLVSLLMVDWPDSSVGCPKPNADYADGLTPGYRMVFRAGETRLIYHTSIRHFVRCAPEEEILPGVLHRALPTPEPETTEE